MILLNKIKAFYKGKISSTAKFLKRGAIKTKGIALPPKFSLGKDVKFEILNKGTLIIGNNFNFGDYSLIKFFQADSSLFLGNNVTARRACLLQLFGGRMEIGNNVFFNNNCSISCFGEIKIGDGTMFGENVKLYDHNHKYEIASRQLNIHPNEFAVGKILIGKNCWIASNVIILNNVTIGDNVIIGAGCIIYKSVPSNTIVKNKQDLLIQNYIS